ncbi:FAD-dependent monooxygenase [Nocardia sp. NPDC055053]
MDTDVIVVGAGPTGLMLAGELRLAGARVVVVERLLAPTGQSRGLGFTARAMETFDQRGLLPAFGPLETSPLGHFGGMRFDYTVLTDCHFGARGVPQSQTESVLENWAVGLGAELRRGWDLRQVHDRGDHVEAVGVRDGQAVVLSARYLVGCDGGRSTVRKLAGFDFPGTSAGRTMYLADVVGCSIPARPLGERLPGGMVMAAPLEPGVDRVIVCEHGVPGDERADEVDFAEVAAAWERITGESIRHGSATWASAFTDTTRQVTEYRRGRILLAGDAAHVHLPAGGQGLSTGIQDAANLGWKLGAVLSGWGTAELLNTYHTERHPVGERLLWNTRVQGMTFLGGAEAEPLRSLLTELLEIDDTKRHLAGLVSGLDVRYPCGPDDHRLVGRRIPPRKLQIASGVASTFELLHPARGVLLDLADRPDIRELAKPWSDRVIILTAATADDESFGVATGLLVRPDGYVVWGVDGPGAPNGLEAALRQWFGEPIQ